MKYSILFLLCGLLGIQQGYSQGPKPVDHQLSAVTVFLAGAQVTRKAKVKLATGDNILRFPKLATGILPNSIQATAPTNVLINSVSYEVNYLDPVDLAPKVRNVRDSIETVGLQLSYLKDQQAVLHTEKNMIKANQALGGTGQGVTVEELQKLSDFYRSRLGQIQKERDRLQLKEKNLTGVLKRLNAQLSTLNGSRNQASNDILVVVKTDRPTTTELEISYLVQNAGWQPSYDLRVTDTNQPLDLTYRAEVFQNTGLDWKDVKLTLSTANPNQNGNQPQLSQWNLRLVTPTRISSAYDKKGAYSKSANEAAPAGGYFHTMDREQSISLANFTDLTEGATTAEFAIDIPQNIPSDGQRQQVAIQNSTLPATYEHLTIPKLDDDAFLLAHVTNWENLNLLPGAANIFFEGTFIAQSFINPSLTSDTLSFSLGRDPKVVIERKQLKDHNKTRTFGSNRERTFGFEIMVKNAKSSSIKLKLKDQIPVSQNNDITVKLIEQSDASHNEATGAIQWNIELGPGESQKVKLIYSVKYPKNSNISGL